MPVDNIEIKCEVRKKSDLPVCNAPVIFQHIFFCEHLYDPSKGYIKQLPAHIKLRYSTAGGDADSRKRKGKCKEGENVSESGASITKLAIEYEEPAGDAFKLNHPESLVFIINCNVILRAVMEKCGDTDDCIATSEAAELAASLDEKVCRCRGR
ncbi:hypothetical protein L3X38_038115 [Prunus dulcis]|uniref:BAH domain-containing protein n=1 Tax=Prunus dulcis TaxID=3755 RepID=A0AAD4V6S4_PRUDU|nr:hypothetical protein L3X38_038115 [Prunus dulcis]